jgi:hypothetical protein
LVPHTKITEHPLTLAGWLLYVNVLKKVLFTAKCHTSTVSVANSLHDCHSHYIWCTYMPSDIYVCWFFHMLTSICHTNTLFTMHNFLSANNLQKQYKHNPLPPVHTTRHKKLYFLTSAGTCQSAFLCPSWMG